MIEKEIIFNVLLIIIIHIYHLDLSLILVSDGIVHYKYICFFLAS